jgi:hypothetical protein
MYSIRKAILGVALIGTIGALGACADDPLPPWEPEGEGPVITMTGPNGGNTVLPGDVITITWTVVGGEGVSGVDLTYTADDVAETVIASDLVDGVYDWTTPSDVVLYGVTIKGVATDGSGHTDEDMTDGMLAVIQFSERGYVTSAGCVDCHEGAYSDVFDFSGHPYKLNKVVDGVAPTYPNSVVPSPPAGVDWTDVSYVIGGYGWKARFIGTEAFNQGYIITGFGGAGPLGSNQWNLLPETWTDYHVDELKPYDCGSCHTTGWQSLDENGGVHQDGLTGFEGTFEEQGVTCEQCHGVGIDHVATQSSDDITIDITPELCGSCHNRGLDPIDLIPASGGFIKHHEQYNEWANSGGHFNGGADCYACHDSHLGTLYDNGGFITTCETCHADKVDNNNHLTAIDCVTCHMPKASKSAVPAEENTIYEGDIQTHIFKINPAAVGMDEFFTADGSAVVDDPIGVTLDFVCYQCHDDPGGEGGGFSEKTLAELSARATGIHTP